MHTAGTEFVITTFQLLNYNFVFNLFSSATNPAFQTMAAGRGQFGNPRAAGPTAGGPVRTLHPARNVPPVQPAPSAQRMTSK